MLMEKQHVGIPVEMGFMILESNVTTELTRVQTDALAIVQLFLVMCV